jgi:hypothetical protein
MQHAKRIAHQGNAAKAVFQGAVGRQNGALFGFLAMIDHVNHR